jgi:hypothetical protein
VKGGEEADAERVGNRVEVDSVRGGFTPDSKSSSTSKVAPARYYRQYVRKGMLTTLRTMVLTSSQAAAILSFPDLGSR